jgi:hypothetical protein
MANKNILVGEVPLQELLDRLAFSEEGTPVAAMEQPKLFMAAASYRIKRMKDRQEAEAKLDNLKVDLSLKIRARNLGKKGATERYLNDMVASSPQLRVAVEEANKAKRIEEWAKLLLEAYEHRRGSLRVMAQFAYIEENFSATGNEVEKLRGKRERLKRTMPMNEEDEV